MAGKSGRPEGWNFREAARRTVDPGLLTECISAERASDRVAINSGRREMTERIVDDLRGHLESGRLLAWGKRVTRAAKLEPIAPSEWPLAKLSFPRRAMNIKIGDEKIIDLRIYPVLNVPNGLAHLIDKPLLEAFRNYVFGDPQVAVLRKRAIAKGGEPYKIGFQRRLMQAIWPVSYCPKSVFNKPMGNRCNELPSTRFANLVLARRFARLVRYFIEGGLVAEGVQFRDGSLTKIPRALWLRERAFIELTNGDLLEYRPEGNSSELYSLLFLGLMIRSPNTMLHVKPPVDDDVRSNTALPSQTKKSVVAVERRNVAYEECVEWLTEIMRASPKKRTEINASLWAKAKKKWPITLSNRAFLNARAEAIRQSKATVWGAGGAPKQNRSINRRTV